MQKSRKTRSWSELKPREQNGAYRFAYWRRLIRLYCLGMPPKIRRTLWAITQGLKRKETDDSISGAASDSTVSRRITHAIRMRSVCSQDAIRMQPGLDQDADDAYQFPDQPRSCFLHAHSPISCSTSNGFVLDQQRITSACWRVRYNSNPGPIQREALLRLISLTNLGLLPLQLARMALFTSGPTIHSCLSFQLTCCITFHDSRFVL